MYALVSVGNNISFSFISKIQGFEVYVRLMSLFVEGLEEMSDMGCQGARACVCVVWWWWYGGGYCVPVCVAQQLLLNARAVCGVVLLLAVLLAAPIALGVGSSGAVWSNADPKRTVLVAESSLVGSVALAVWYWADPKRTMLLAEVSLDGEGGATAWKDAHNIFTPTVFVAESS
jgi:hypothetical protein